ncbi:MAG: D-glycerate dehydrogenase [Clostridia bacterium]|nr:D-glycerate dehydrogenase [Clostridia bacterium]MCL6522492.1 D-glycerate dehydrogenase [Bacillota bacterium]
MAARVVVTGFLPGGALDRLAEAVEVVGPPGEEVERRGWLLEAVGEADGLLCLLVDRVDRELLEAAPRLRVVSTLSTGVDHIDLEACRERGIVVAHSPDVLTEATADLAWALMLAAARRVAEGDRLVRAGGFRGWRPDLLLGTEVYGRTLGIVGLGRIGRAVAKRASGFDMNVVYWNRTEIHPMEDEWLGISRVELDELLAKADFVSVHLAYTPQTHHFIGRRELALMAPHAVLVNTSRGAVIDEAALAEALEAGRPAAAGLDVFEREPEVEPRLLRLPQVVLTPHIGSATRQTREAMARLAVDNLLAALEGRRPAAAVE